MQSFHVVENGPLSPSFLTDAGDDDDAARTSASRKPPVTSDTATILVVDDDMANLALAEAILQAEGFQVRVATDFGSMLEVLKTITPTLMLMDIQLPEVDGWELTRQLTAVPATSGIPIIAITAYGKIFAAPMTRPEASRIGDVATDSSAR